ncbi:menaquinone biosynthesis protein [soil metagenome]
MSYLNSRPFIKGLHELAGSGQFEISEDIPAICATKLLDGAVDIGLIPVAIIPQLGYSSIITDFCISADGDVASVLLVSNDPLENLKVILLDKESRTSVMLVRILAREQWKIEPVWQNEEAHSFDDLPTGSGAVIIGDRALKNRHRFKYVYDLAGEWKKMTGLPFVFACWVANKAITADVVEQLNTVFKLGLESRASIAKEYQPSFPQNNIEDYLHKNIQYIFGDEEKKGLELFLKYLEDFNKP